MTETCKITNGITNVISPPIMEKIFTLPENTHK